MSQRRTVVAGQPPADASAGLSDMLVGILPLAIAAFAPWLTFRFVHWSGLVRSEQRRTGA